MEVWLGIMDDRLCPSPAHLIDAAALPSNGGRLSTALTGPTMMSP
jgi:hypothetical protein